MSAKSGVDDGDWRKRRLVYQCFISNQVNVLLNKVSDSQFSEIFNCLAANGKPWKGSAKVFRVFKDAVKEKVLNELGDMNDTVKMDDKLKLLDELYDKYADSKDIVQWRPNGNVSETLVSHDMAEKLMRKVKLEELVNKKMEEIQRLKEKLNHNCSLLKTEEELDDEIERVNNEYACEHKNFNHWRKMTELISDTH